MLVVRSKILNFIVFYDKIYKIFFRKGKWYFRFVNRVVLVVNINLVLGSKYGVCNIYIVG